MEATTNLEGIAGSGQRCEFPDQPKTTLSAWLINVPLAHPFWFNYMLCCVTLEDTEGFPPAVRQYAEAQYEILVMALDPQSPPKPDDVTTWIPLHPANFVRQFHGVNDADAALVAQYLVTQVVNGQLFIEPSGIMGARDMWHQAVDKAVLLLTAIEASEDLTNES